MLYGASLLLLTLLPLLGRAQAAPDSAMAIRQLFWQRRQLNIGLAVGCGGAAPGTGATAPVTSQWQLPPGAVAGLGTNCSLLTIIDRMRYSVAREQQVLRRLALHHRLPAYVRRELGPVLASR